MDVVLLFVSWPLPKKNVVSELFASHGCFSGSTVLALSKYATICTVNRKGWKRRGRDQIEVTIPVFYCKDSKQ
jgi:hypothetical protein